MLVKTIRKPGQKGTRKLVEQYGDQLVCVRYRYDFKTKKKYKTIELIIGSEEWEPENNWTLEQDSNPKSQRETTPWVGVKVSFNEKDLQRAIKNIGGYWDLSKRLWFAPEYQVKQIGLQDRIVCRKRY